MKYEYNISVTYLFYYISYFYRGLRSKGNSYAHDDFCVSDNEYEEDISNSENNIQEIEEEDTNYDSDYQSLDNKQDYEINNEYQEQLLNNYQDNSLYSQDSIISEIKEKKRKKKRKTIILESSYDNEESNEDENNKDNDKEKGLKNNDNDVIIINSSNNTINNKNSSDINYNYNDNCSDLEIFSSSPVLPSIDACMDKLFSNPTTPQRNRSNSVKGKNKNFTNDCTVNNELLGNSTSIKENDKESYDTSKDKNNKINDPLNLFSDDMTESISKHLNYYKSQIKEKSSSKKTKNKIAINDDFSIDENLLGTNIDYNYNRIIRLLTIHRYIAK